MADICNKACIDKSSSVELSEAINSMYRWYRNSQTCYVFLNDVTLSEDRWKAISQLVQSEWFQRGWTLQELLAPHRVVFLDKNWKEFGSKGTLANEISLATGIWLRYIRSSFLPTSASSVIVAEKMTWTRMRKTSRVEDKAYCLLGLFNINMPLLYGEGTNAFRRLQLEIMKSSEDESIFAWSMLSETMAPFSPWSTGVLTESPYAFHGTVQYSNLHRGTPVEGVHKAPYLFTNKGLEFQVPVKLAREEYILLPLNCIAYKGTYGNGGVYAIALHRQLDPNTGSWTRVKSGFPMKWDFQSIPESEGLFAVPMNQLWSREDLKKSGSEIIYLQLWDDYRRDEFESA